ncbi:MAG: phosphoribosylanthranilate isomerase [Burkholderiaceae bacterium]
MTVNTTSLCRTRIKICGLTRPQDVDAAVDSGADAIWIVFYAPSPRSVSIAQAARLARFVPAWVSLVGLFVNTPQEEILRVANQVGLSHIQLHGDEQPQQYAGLGRPIVKAIRLPASAGPPSDSAGPPSAPSTPAAAIAQTHLLESETWRERAQAVLFDADSTGFGGSGHVFDWGILSDMSRSLGRHWVLSGGLRLENIAQALATLSPPAIDVSSGVEQVINGRVQKGVKDPVRMRAFVQAVREFDLVRPT